MLESTDPDGPIAKYLEKRGEGIQHIAFQVKNLEEALAELKEKGVKLIDEKPRKAELPTSSAPAPIAATSPSLSGKRSINIAKLGGKPYMLEEYVKLAEKGPRIS